MNDNKLATTERTADLLVQTTSVYHTANGAEDLLQPHPSKFCLMFVILPALPPS